MKPTRMCAEAAKALELLSSVPTAEEVLALRPSAGLSQHVSELVEKSRHCALSHDEEVEWQRFAYLEHRVRVAKAMATAKQKNP